MSEWNLERVDDLVLVRLATPRKAPYRRSELPKLLGRYLEHGASAAEVRGILEASVERLLAAGHLAPPITVTPDGRRRAEAAMGGPIPARWATVEARGLVLAALGRPGDKKLAARVADAQGLQAVLLSKAHALDAPATPTLAQALDALVWQGLGVANGGPLTLEKLRVWALDRSLKGTARGGSRQLARRAAAVATGARGGDPAALRRAVVGRWLTEEAGAHAPAQEEALVDAVRRAVRDPATPRYSPRDAYIAGVYDALAAHPARRGLSLADFKARLVEAHRAGLLHLARADLVAAMDPELVARSETHYLNATFHFIVTDAEES